MITLTSVHNPKIKQLMMLQQKSSERRKTGLFVIEGRRELQHCIDSHYEIDTIFFQPDIANNFQPPLSEKQCIAVSKKVYEKIAYRNTTEGVVAIVRGKSHDISSLVLSKTPLIIVIQGVEKPGNIGAILRSADAAQTDAVIICDSPTDIYNPNVIRNSLGAVFTTQIAVCSSEVCINYLKQHNIQILTAQLQDSKPYYNTDMTRSTAIVMGTESVGLTQEWRNNADFHINIPMLGQLDSLNVSVSTAILTFEAVRQRQSDVDI